MYSRVNRISTCLAFVPSQEKALGELTAHAKGATTQYCKHSFSVTSRPSAHSKPTLKFRKYWGMTHSVENKGPGISAIVPWEQAPSRLCSLQPAWLLAMCTSQLQRNSGAEALLLPQTAPEFVAGPQCFPGDRPSSPLPSFSLSSCIQVSKRAFYKLHSRAAERPKT